MKKVLLAGGAILALATANGQIKFDPSIDTAFMNTEFKLPASPLSTQVLFIGGVDMVETTPTYGNPGGQKVAKQWHDFIGFTPDNATGTSDLGWVSVNHEMVEQDNLIGDGGGMTTFKIKREGDSLVIVNQTLGDGRSGTFFNVDFVNTVGETGMNCGGIVSPDGRIWTAEEWWQGSLDPAFRDTADFVVGTTTPAGFPGFNGASMTKVENLNYMVEIDPREAKAIRKQYNWGRQPFEGGAVMPDNKTVYLGTDDTPGLFTKFVATTAGDFTAGDLFVFKHDATGAHWVQIDNSDFTTMLHYADTAIAHGATMFNRLEWVTEVNGKVYFTETGRANPGSRWADDMAKGGVFAPHHVNRATAQGTTPDNSAYVDYYGRVLMYDPATDEVTVHLAGGPDYATSPAVSAYPAIHLSNPDGLSKITINGQPYLIICEDLNQTDFGSMPAGIGNAACEIFLLDLSIASPTVDDLLRIGITPVGAEVTGAIGLPDGKTILVNSQHPDGSNPYPWNNSLTVAINGFDKNAISILEHQTADGFTIYPNPVSRELRFSEITDAAIYDNSGKRIRVYRNTQSIDVTSLSKGVYYLQNGKGNTYKFIVE